MTAFLFSSVSCFALSEDEQFELALAMSLSDMSIQHDTWNETTKNDEPNAYKLFEEAQDVLIPSYGLQVDQNVHVLDGVYYNKASDFSIQFQKHAFYKTTNETIINEVSEWFKNRNFNYHYETAGDITKETVLGYVKTVEEAVNNNAAHKAILRRTWFLSKHSAEKIKTEHDWFLKAIVENYKTSGGCI
ncbi:MAG TPA: hypothetical protein VI959_05255, partial [Alphaproteobacteria bacterium]|nr:hypothetical protein [Alphaproteobacteria bacterium]